MADDILPVLVMIIAFFLPFLMQIRGVSIRGRYRLSPRLISVEAGRRTPPWAAGDGG